jgi:uncharacterized membrane protein
MAFCKACGQEIGTATFCPKCGASQAAGAAPVAAPAVSNAPATSGIEENIAGLLCYVLGWVTGILFLLIDKRPFVKFHAAQSIVVFGGLTVIRIGLGMMGVMTGGLLGHGMFWGLLTLVSFLTFVLWILLMIKAYQHEWFKVPIAAPIAESIAGK